MAVEKMDLKLPKIDNDDEKEQAISEMRQLIQSPGWQFLKKVLEQNIAEKEQAILDDINDKAVIYNEDDRLKDQRRFLLKLLELPEEQLSILMGEETEEDYDPYYKSTEEMQ